MKDTSYNSSFITYDDDANWLITYADLMTLLLVFFVLLYSLAYFEKEKYMSRVETIKLQLKDNEEFTGVMEIFDKSGTLDRKISLEDITGLRSRETLLLNAINQIVGKLDQDKNIGTKARNGKIIVTVSGEALFSSGSATLNPEALPVFDRMTQIFDDFLEYNINIKGHTDNIPISTRAFPSNWELSAIRATTVLKYLVLKGIKPQRLTATGYGDIIPLAPNTTDENKARNRRVEFVLEKNETNN
jgi:chemotaxis protein MotB